MKPQYEFNSYDYTIEYFARMVREKRHLPFRKWLMENGHISKGMRITSHIPEYIVPLFRKFEGKEL